MVKARLKGNGMREAPWPVPTRCSGWSRASQWTAQRGHCRRRRSCYPGWTVPTFASPTFGVAVVVLSFWTT